MKSSIPALLTAIALLTTYAPAQQLNPPPDPCCDCYEIRVEGVAIDSIFYADTKGAYTAYVRVLSKGTGSNCPSNIKVRLAAAVVKDGIVISNTMQLRETIIDGGSKVLKFTLTPEQAKLGNMWRFSSDCLGKLNENDGGGEPNGVLIDGCKYQDFPLNSCSSCKPCESTGAATASNGKQSKFSGISSTGGFLANIGITSSMGGQAKGNLSFDVEQFANPGRSFLIANASSDFTVNRTGGLITSIVTGANTVEVAAADAAILALDPNAFTITHKDPSGNAFRTTTISFVTEAGIPRLRMDTTYEGATTRYEQTKPQADTLILEEGRVVSGTFESLSRDTIVRSEPSPGLRVERRTLAERASTASAWVTTTDIEETWEKQYAGWVQTKEVNDPAGAALTSTWTYYQPGEHTGPDAATEGIGMLKLYTRYDGYRAFHTYSLNQSSVTTPYASNPSGRVAMTTWDPGTQTSTETTRLEGIMVSKLVTIQTATSETNVTHSSATDSLTSVTHFVPSGQDFGGQPLRTIYPDGTLTTYAYTRNSGGGYTTVTESGSTENETIVAKGTRTTTTVNSRGTTILRKTEAIGYGTGNTIFDCIAVTSVDQVGRAIDTAYYPESTIITGETVSATNPAWVTSNQYSCCGISSQTDQYGIKTFYAYDGLQRLIKSNTLGVTTETHFNGLTVETHRYAEAAGTSVPAISLANSNTIISKSVRNLSGTLQESWSPDPTSVTAGALVRSSLATTTYVNSQSQYLPLNLGSGIGSRTNTTKADGFIQTTDSFLDGRPAKTYGALSPAMEYAYTVNTTGEVTSQSYVDGTNLRETTSTQTDWDGRTIRMDYLDEAFSTMEYNTKGQMVKSTDPDGVVSLMLYNPEGEQTITAIDLNRNGAVDYGSDTVQFSESIPALDSNNAPVWKSISKVWQPGDPSPTGGTVVSTSLQTPNGLLAVSQSIGVANASTSATTLNGNGSWTTTSTAPDGTKSVSNYSDGKMVSMARLATNNSVIESQAQEYDLLNRPKRSIHSRTGTNTTNYLSATADIVASVSDPGNRVTAFVYDVRGRQISVNAPDTLDANNQPLTNVTSTTYNPDSTIAETDGDQTYRVSHTYDYADRQIGMTTYGTTTATTTWQYSTTRGFLLAKRDAANKGVDYTYTAAGRIATRTWGRSAVAHPKITEYSYDNGGRMIATNYSDSTPDVEMAYDALNRPTSQTNGLASSVFTYNSSNLQIDAETITYTLPGKPAFTRVIDRSQDTLGRESGWQLKAGTTIENDVQYLFSTTEGRLATVRRGDILVPQEFNYTYTANSNLIATVTTSAHIVSNVYETTRDILSSKVNKKLDTTAVSSYNYTVNNFAQRTGVNTGGSAFTGSPSWSWGYNNKGEIVKADHSTVSALNRAYQYDGIGNRTSGSAGASPASTTSYTPNALNQYSDINSLNPVHDYDGNMTSGSLPANVNANSILIWDGENRLIEAQVNSGATVSYVYDSQSRQIAETVGSNTTVYIYDGWNPIAEYSTSFALTKTYTWGLDLSGSMQGAGGVGGLLMVTVGSAGPVDRYFPTFDGNGNVSEYLDSNGNTVAHYEYDPFGKTTVSNGSKVNDFAHRFSTKPLDLTTGLYYYGYRFYDPETGRWPSRDPIEEEGGVNLYSFVINDGINNIDLFGAIKYEFVHTKKVGPIVNGEGPYGQPGGNTTSVFIKSTRRAASHTVTESGRRNIACNSISTTNTGSENGGSIYVYAIAERWERHSRWEFTVKAAIRSNSYNKKIIRVLPIKGGGGAVTNAYVMPDSTAWPRETIVSVRSDAGNGSIRDSGQKDVRKYLCKRKTLIAIGDPILRVNVFGEVAESTISMTVLSERKVSQ